MKNKIIHILHSVGGVDVSLRHILNNIDDDVFENIVIHGDNDTEKEFTTSSKSKIKEYKLSIYRNIAPFKDIKAIFSTRRILRREKPNLIHAHSAKGGVISRLAAIGLRIKVLHTPQAYSYLSTNSTLKRIIYLQIEKALAKLNSTLVASSLSEKNRGVNEVKYEKNNALLFNNSINDISITNKLTIEKTWPNNYICTVGRPSYQKNLEMMIKVISKIKENDSTIHLVIMGVGYYSPELESVKELIDNLGLKSNITLVEWTTQENIFSIIDKSQAYITTARYEGLPYSVIESMAIGKPIIATDADGNRDLVIHNENGYLFGFKQIDEMAASTREVIENKILNKQFSEKSRKLFLENYNITSNIKKLEALYKSKIN